MCGFLVLMTGFSVSKNGRAHSYHNTTWLVVSTYPSEKYESQEWEYDSLIKMEKAPNVPNHQAAQHFD